MITVYHLNVQNIVRLQIIYNTCTYHWKFRILLIYDDRWFWENFEKHVLMNWCRIEVTHVSSWLVYLSFLMTDTIVFTFLIDDFFCFPLYLDPFLCLIQQLLWNSLKWIAKTLTWSIFDCTLKKEFQDLTSSCWFENKSQRY